VQPDGLVVDRAQLLGAVIGLTTVYAPGCGTMCFGQWGVSILTNLILLFFQRLAAISILTSGRGAVRINLAASL
jgi:hypothetical protein